MLIPTANCRLQANQSSAGRRVNRAADWPFSSHREISERFADEGIFRRWAPMSCGGAACHSPDIIKRQSIGSYRSVVLGLPICISSVRSGRAISTIDLRKCSPPASNQLMREVEVKFGWPPNGRVIVLMAGRIVLVNGPLMVMGLCYYIYILYMSYVPFWCERLISNGLAYVMFFLIYVLNYYIVLHIRAENM